jgi:hypothetical protein
MNTLLPLYEIPVVPEENCGVRGKVYDLKVDKTGFYCGSG